MVQLKSHDSETSLRFLLSCEGCYALRILLDKLQSFQPSGIFMLRAAMYAVIHRKAAPLTRNLTRTSEE